MSDTHPVAAAPLPHDFCYRTFQPHVYSTTFRMFRIFRFGVSRGRSTEHVMTRARASGNSPVWPRSLVRKMGEWGVCPESEFLGSLTRTSVWSYHYLRGLAVGLWGKKKRECVMCIFVCGGMGEWGSTWSRPAQKVSLARIDRQRVLHGPTAGEAVLDTSICGI